MNPRYVGLSLVVFVTLVAGTQLATVKAQDADPIAGYTIAGTSTDGPHQIELQVSPPRPIVGTTRFAIRVRDATSLEDIGDASVRIFGSPPESGRRQTSIVLNSPADPKFYLAQLDLEKPGRWTIEINAESSGGNSITLMSLDVSARGRSGSGTGWGTVLFILATLSIVGSVAWLKHSSTKALKRRAKVQARNRKSSK